MIDQNTAVNNKKTILVGMTGRMDSTVAAYLLKKQGFNCIGISLVFFQPNDLASEIFSKWHIPNLENVKAICNALEIPFYGVNAQEVFRDKVLDFAVASRLAGKTFSPAIFSNRVIIQTLASKMETLKADAIATGHYAKVLRNHKTQDVAIMAANDQENDQSYLLAGLDQETLDKIFMPLAEMRRLEVEKVSKLIGVKLDENIRGDQLRIMRDPKFTQYIESAVAETLRKEGNLINYQEDTIFSDHKGIHHYHIGQNKIESNSKTNATIDATYEVIDIHPGSGSVYLDFPSKLHHTHCYLKNFICEKGYDSSAPQELYVQFSERGEKIPCFVYFKNNKTVLIEFKEKREGLLELGLYGVLYNKKEYGSVIGGGVVGRSGFIENGQWHRLPIKDAESEEDEEVQNNIISNHDLQF